MLVSNLCRGPPVSDALDQKRAAAALESLKVPDNEQPSERGCLRQIDALEADVAEPEQALAKQVIGARDPRRLLSVPASGAVRLEG